MKVLWIHCEGRNKRHLEVWQSWHQVLQEELGMWHPGAKVQASDFPLTDWLDAAANSDGPALQEAVAHLAQGQAIRGMGDVLRGTQVVSAAIAMAIWTILQPVNGFGRMCCDAPGYCPATKRHPPLAGPIRELPPSRQGPVHLSSSRRTGLCSLG